MLYDKNPNDKEKLIVRMDKGNVDKDIGYYTIITT